MCSEIFERGKGWYADCDRDCADADRADGGGRGFAVIGISGGFWKPARNCAGTDGNPICAGSAQCCASVFQQRGGEPLLDLYKEAGCDSFAGRAASIIMSCTETVFYTMTVYFGAVRIKNAVYSGWRLVFFSCWNDSRCFACTVDLTIFLIIPVKCVDISKRLE